MGVPQASESDDKVRNASGAADRRSSARAGAGARRRRPCRAGGEQRATASTTVVTRVGSLEAHLFRQINSLRVGKGLGSLSRSSALTRAAAAHSESMATLGFFEHESRNGASLATRLGRFYRPRAQQWIVGENLAMFGGGAPTAEAIVAAWMASPPTAQPCCARCTAMPASRSCTTPRPVACSADCPPG